jgi:hypothetical protein
VPSFEETLRAINEMKSEGIVEDYAIAGGMAMAFWVEAIPTYDLDVLVFLPTSEDSIVSLGTIYGWASKRGFPSDREHILIEGVPVQFLPSHGELSSEAIRRAVEMSYGEVSTRVVRPEYLIALYLQGSARTPQRRERAAALRESGVDESILQDLLGRFKLTP